MYDFAQHGLLDTPSNFSNMISTSEAAATTQKKKKTKEKPQATPKEIYKMSSLNANEFRINCDPEYLKKQIADARYKLGFMRKKDNNDPLSIYGVGGVKYGREEVESIIERLENRKKIKTCKTVLDEFPHTTSALINAVVKENRHLRCKRAEEFIPDFPREALDAMKKYEDMCAQLCNKKPIFYVIGDTSDFEKKDKRRDPILLAQSPFGFFWQILGAWDEEMIYLGDL